MAARLGLALAALALLSQSLVLAAPMNGRLSQARAAQAQLAALLGPEVVICTQSDEPGSPPAPGCHEDCPLCRLAADISALDVPAPPAVLIPAKRAAVRFVAFSPSRARPADPALHPLPRGPPSKA